MLTVEQLTKAGAQIVAGKVIFEGRFVEGGWTEVGFEPAPGEAIAEPAPKKRTAKAEEAPKAE